MEPILDSFKHWMQQEQKWLQKRYITTEERKQDDTICNDDPYEPFIGYIHESKKAVGQVTLWASRQMEFEVINLETEERLLWTYVEQIEEQEASFKTILEPYFGALQSGDKV
ncbi:hypothetical protein GCM10008014_10790 [Paenibacillus silvae]|uniref:DUF4288 domain-containing protein n=1 Tax=Paenibacillus silvae TaxID=1325358 RepID=A0ABQ1Z3G2_9BACL|nr:hypothetical protein [Paenibacillus silvae]GGH47453.1 hypothetical protein GCM10008014_10790 [Paenibacillus silvae]